METPELVQTRLAPTPSGFLHAGNAFSFVLTWLLARRYAGRLHLRIDDLDAARARPDYLADIFETLDWLGLDYDTGPRDTDHFTRQFSQQHRLNDYHALLTRLRKAGWIYACACSRSDIQTVSGKGIYPGTCRERKLDPDKPGLTWRFRLPEQTEVVMRELNGQSRRIVLNEAIGDFVVRRRDGIPAYQVASLADDLRYGCNLIVRGADLIPSTAAQLFLARVLSLDHFSRAVFYHHPLLTDAAGQKLSKSAGAAGLRILRQEWRSPQPLFRTLATYLGIDPAEIDTARDLLDRFHAEQLPTVR